MLSGYVYALSWCSNKDNSSPNMLPESNHDKTPDRQKFKDIQQNTWLVLSKVKIMKGREQDVIMIRRDLVHRTDKCSVEE
jgi:hypothetical protein